MLLLFAAGFFIGGFSPLQAQVSTNQNVFLLIDEINLIGTSGDVTLHIRAVDWDLATGIGTATDSSSTYALITNAVTPKKVTGLLTSAMPTNTTLAINLAAPAPAVSQGETVLTLAAQDLVRGITQTSWAAQTITYTFRATPNAAPITTPVQRIVTLTITDDV